jgi:hypothetical protein
LVDIYYASENWSVLSGNMQYLEPLESQGKASLGGNIYTDLIYTLANGFRFKPSGYAADTQVTLVGTLVVEGGGNYAVPPTTGSPVQWYVQAVTAGTITSVGSGMSTAEHDKLFALPSNALTTGKFIALR